MFLPLGSLSTIENLKRKIFCTQISKFYQKKPKQI